MVTYCSLCGEELERKTFVIPATGHTPGEWVEENRTEATCTENGSYDRVLYCIDEGCEGVELSRETFVIYATGHTEGEWTQTEASTCTVPGEEAVFCTVCGDVLETRKTEKLSHTYGDWITLTEADCVHDGSQYKCCEFCDAKEVEKVPAFGHTEGEAVTENQVETSCSSDGGYDTVVYCTVCDEEISRVRTVFPAYPHTEVTDEGKEMTCTQDGLTEGKHCSVCGTVTLEQEVIPASGHDYEAEVTPPTMTSDGYTTYTCTVCGHTYVGDITERLAAVITGKVVSFGSETEEVKIELVREGQLVASHTIYVTGNNAEYSLEGVEAGEYKLYVSKKDHTTRIYDVSVSEADVLIDLKIHLVGDINGDGKANTVDVSMANSHAKKIQLLEGYEALCAEVTGDRTVNTVDVSRINSHAKRVNLLW